MIPLQHPYNLRKKKSAIRTLSLPTSNVCTKPVLELLVSCIIKGTMNGFEGIKCEEAKSNSIRIVMDFRRFLGKYPASSHAIGLMNHSAGVDCTDCTFPYQTG